MTAFIKNTSLNNISIQPLRWWQLLAYLSLRQEIESESPHLVVQKGERRGSILLVLARIFLARHHSKTLIALDGKKIIGYITITFARFKKLRGNGYLVVS